MLGHATPQFTWQQYVTVFESDLSGFSMDWADALDRAPEHAPGMPPTPVTA